MIRKCFGLNSGLVKILKCLMAPKNLHQRWCVDNQYRFGSDAGSYSLHTGNEFMSPSSSSLSSGGHSKKPRKSGPVQMRQKSDPERFAFDIRWPELQLDETWDREFFEIRGPMDSAFLVEVCTNDMKEVRVQLEALQGDDFYFDQTVVDWFHLKGLVAARPPVQVQPCDRLRLANVHAIASGSDCVCEVDGFDQLLFVNSMENVERAKRMLNKFNYSVSGVLYKFEPCHRTYAKDETLERCSDFLKGILQMPEVLSVTHNL